MSSRFSAAICARVLRRQSEAGVAGPVVEIGAFEGRFLIAMALALEPGERAYGVDTFTGRMRASRSASSPIAA
jgi:hypothetical protein